MGGRGPCRARSGHQGEVEIEREREGERQRVGEREREGGEAGSRETEG